MNKSSQYAQDLWNKDRRHWLHPWTHFASFKEYGSLVIERAEGVHVYDAEGNRYLDGIGGLWCVNLGYGREEIARAMYDQACKLCYAGPFTDVSNVPAAELAARLAELAPGDLNHVFFSCGGTEANEMAYRMVEFYWNVLGKPEKRHWISRKESYHGGSHITQSMGGKRMDRMPEFSYRDDIFHHLASPDPYLKPEGMSEGAFCDQLVQEFEDKVSELGADRIAAFIAEPIMGAGGVIVAPDGYLKRLRALCVQHDILFISDEVVTAFGRVGHWFSSRDMFGIQPDMICTAKGLTSAYQPLGATIFSDRINDVLFSAEDSRLFTSGFTYSGHPVACAAALKNIELMERENILQRVRDVGAYFQNQLESLSDLATVGAVRGSHFMMCIVNVADKDSRTLFPESVNIGKRIAIKAQQLGLLVRPVGHLNIFSPPLTLNRGEVDFIINTMREAMLAVEEDLREAGLL